MPAMSYNDGDAEPEWFSELPESQKDEILFLTSIYSDTMTVKLIPRMMGGNTTGSSPTAATCCNTNEHDNANNDSNDSDEATRNSNETEEHTSNNSNKSKGRNNSKKQASKKKKSSSSAAAAASQAEKKKQVLPSFHEQYTVQLRLPLEAANVSVTFIAALPPSYPEAGGIPDIRLRSVNASLPVIRKLEDHVQQAVNDSLALGDFNFMTIIGQATDMVHDIPCGLLGTHFGYCFQCNQKNIKARQPKVPSPLKVISAEVNAKRHADRTMDEKKKRLQKHDGSGAVAGSATPDLHTQQYTSRYAYEFNKKHPEVAQFRSLCGRKPDIINKDGNKDENDVPFHDSLECVICHSADVLLVPSLKLNTEALCDFCYCEESPLFHTACGCVGCVSCFQRFALIATGEKDVRRGPQTGLPYGIPCPNHPTAVPITDYGLIKLTDGTCFARFNYFSMLAGAADVGAVACPLPQCCAMPTWADAVGDFMRCAYCREWSCTVCFEKIINCTCDKRKGLQYVNRKGVPAEVDQLVTRHWVDLPLSEYFGPSTRVLFVSGPARVPVTLPTDALSSWQDQALQEIPSKDRPDFFRLFHHGRPLPRGPKSPREFGLYPGSIVYVIELKKVWQTRDWDMEYELYEFRKQVAADRGEQKPPEGIEKNKLFKSCSKCGAKVVHYKNHGCHHIGGPDGKCCGHHWCYVCGGPYPCNTCPLMCNEHCGCPPCPDCKPGQPCHNCWGCDRCRISEESEFI